MSELTQRPGRLDIGVVGAGRVGAVLASALRACGHRVVAASGASEESRERIEALLPGVARRDPDDVVAAADLVLLTVPDDALGPLVGGLAALGLFRPGQLIIHTAGRYGTDVLAPAAQAGAIPLAIHPAMTFTGTSIDLSRLEGAPFAVTAAPAVLPIGQALVVEMGGEPIALSDEARIRYHAALAHGANHLITLVAQARRILAGAGVEDNSKLLAPLLEAALDGALTSGEAALTGPVRRGDAGTVQAHVHELARGGDGDILPTYVALAKATAQRSVELGYLTDTAALRILDVLAAGEAPEPTPEPAPGPARGATTVARTLAELRAALTGRSRAVVMTMGALHEGHLSLVRQAKSLAEEVVVTIFVNPLQFGPGEDLEAYPRTFDGDVAKLTDLGVDVVFAPTVEDMYPHQRVTVHAGALGEVLEGAARPGHFDGMLTVVHKLLGLTKPDVAVFGQKDAQQLALIRAMVADLNLDVEIAAAPIVRAGDGLALSSRNAYLSPAEREQAVILPVTVRAGQEAAARGGDADEVLAAARHAFAAHGPDVELDYLVLVDPDSLTPIETAAGREQPGLLAIAARVGNTRLLDNAVIEWPPPVEPS